MTCRWGPPRSSSITCSNEVPSRPKEELDRRSPLEWGLKGASPERGEVAVFAFGRILSGSTRRCHSVCAKHLVG